MHVPTLVPKAIEDSLPMPSPSSDPVPQPEQGRSSSRAGEDH
ncbi:hypothetical protein A2U01_0091622, partial [Trifolium medium]|nr:hypothetical protein [Trifolium medium]